MAAKGLIATVLARLAQFRKDRNLTPDQVEEQLLLGPGWIRKFETGDSTPTLGMLLWLAKFYGRSSEELFAGTAKEPIPDSIERHIYAEQDGNDLLIKFAYAQHDSTYRLKNATVQQYELVIKVLRDGLATLAMMNDDGRAEAVKADSVAKTFLAAVKIWPTASPSDLWWFVVSRAYGDSFNHPAIFARLDLGQSWKRTGGWALEVVLVRHYGPYLKTKGVDLFIENGAQKKDVLVALNLPGEVRAEADKVDVFLAGIEGNKRRPFGVVHVKASFAERRTDDVPLSQAMIAAGLTSPLWTMDCKGAPGPFPVNRGELGVVLGPDGKTDARSAKRKDIEDDGLFSACFSYNSNTAPTPDQQKAKARIFVGNFANPDDAFSKFVIERWEQFKKKK